MATDVDQGELVSIETSASPPTPNSHYSLAAEQFAIAQALVSQFLLLLVGSDGQSGIFGEIKDSIEAPPDTSVDYESISVDFTPTSIGSKPVFSGEITDIPSETIPVPSLTALPSVDLSTLTEPEVPDEVTAVLSWTATTSPTTIFTDLLALLAAWDLGLDPDEEQAIYDRAKQRYQEENADAYERLNNDLLARGLQETSGPFISALGKLAAQIVRQEAEIDNQIIMTQADLLRKREEFKVTQMIALEQLIRTSHEGAEVRALDYAKAVAENTRANAKNAIDLYIADNEAKKSYVMAQVENLKAVVDQNRGIVDLFRGQNEAIKIRVEGIAAQNKAVTDVYVAEMAGFEAGARAIASENQTTIEALRLKLQNGANELQAAIANASNTLQKFIAESSSKEKVIADMAGMMVQALASALGSCNASVNLGYSGSESKSENWSQGKQLSEHHNYEHEVT